MQAKAIARTVGVTPRKARLVVDLIRGKSVTEALETLAYLNKSAVTPVTKVLKSAVANATNNFNMNESSLYIKEAYVDDSIRMRRYLPRAKGSASGLVKRTCHITIVVADE